MGAKEGIGLREQLDRKLMFQYQNYSLNDMLSAFPIKESDTQEFVWDLQGREKHNRRKWTKI